MNGLADWLPWIANDLSGPLKEGGMSAAHLFSSATKATPSRSRVSRPHTIYLQQRSHCFHRLSG